MHPLAYKLRRVLLEDIGLSQGDSILIAVSGGSDSMALLHLLASIRPWLPLELTAAYIDHGLRPDENPQEWALIQAVCKQLQVASTCSQVDVHAVAAQRKLSLEHAARDCRYSALEHIRQEISAKWLALAHTADDQVEELLLRLLRGGSRGALAGMRLHSGKRIRPVLGVRKKELLAYLAQNSLSFCHDSSNDELRFLRNRIRHHLLPLLEQEYDAGIRSALLKCAANLGEDEALLESLQEQAWHRCISSQVMIKANGISQPVWHLALPVFTDLAPALQRRVLERLLYTSQSQASYRHIMALLQLAATGTPGKELHLRNGLRAVVQQDSIAFTFPWGKGATRRSCKKNLNVCSVEPGGGSDLLAAD